MSKHSKWETTRRAKAITDTKRAQQFSKVARLLAIAVREGKSSDPETNPKLRIAIEKAKQINMPKSNIERAIASAQGGAGSATEEIVYELFGPAGVGVVLFCHTDNKNRLLGEIRPILSKFGGSLAGEHSVLWQFSQKGVISVLTNDYEKLFLESSDLGAEDISVIEEGRIGVVTQLEKLEDVKQKLLLGTWNVQSAVPTLIPTNTVAFDEKQYSVLEQFVAKLEDLDDVSEVYTNGVLQTV